MLGKKLTLKHFLHATGAARG